MKNTVFRPISYLLGIGALTIASSSLSVSAEISSGHQSLEPLLARENAFFARLTIQPDRVQDQLEKREEAQNFSLLTNDIPAKQPVATTISAGRAGITQPTLIQTPQDIVHGESPSNRVNSRWVKPAQPKYDPLFGLATAQPKQQSSSPTQYEEINTNPSYINHINRSEADPQIGQPKPKQVSSRTLNGVNIAIAPNPLAQPIGVNPPAQPIVPNPPAQPIGANPTAQPILPNLLLRQLILPNPLAQPIAAAPMPGTAATSAQLLITPPTQQSLPQAGSLSLSHKPSTILAQADLDPRRGRVGVPNYLGLGGNLGLSDNSNGTSLGDGGFVVNSKIRLNSKLSLRPTAIFGNDATFLIPLTYDFTIPTADPFEPVRFAPFLGGGLAIATDDNDSIGFLLTGGIDVPISRAFVANASINIGFIEDETDFGLIIGIGYTFPKR